MAKINSPKVKKPSSTTSLPIQAMSMLLYDGTYLVRYFIPTQEDSSSKAGKYAEGYGTTYEAAVAAAQNALKKLG